jgi:hypothetical protein
VRGVRAARSARLARARLARAARRQPRQYECVRQGLSRSARARAHRSHSAHRRRSGLGRRSVRAVVPRRRRTRAGQSAHERDGDQNRRARIVAQSARRSAASNGTVLDVSDEEIADARADRRTRRRRLRTGIGRIACGPLRAARSGNDHRARRGRRRWCSPATSSKTARTRRSTTRPAHATQTDIASQIRRGSCASAHRRHERRSCLTREPTRLASRCRRRARTSVPASMRSDWRSTCGCAPRSSLRWNFRSAFKAGRYVPTNAGFENEILRGFDRVLGGARPDVSILTSRMQDSAGQRASARARPAPSSG